MSYELKEGQLTIFKNEKKEGSQPDYKGTVNIGGIEKDIALWVKDSKAGKKYFSGKISDKYVPETTEAKPEPVEDDLPF